MKAVYTIGRQFGSGGRKVGKALAEKLGIPYTLEGVRPPSEQEKKQAEELLGMK